MPRKRNLRANKANKNRYGGPLWGAQTPRKLTPKRVTPIRFTRAKYTPAAITPNTAQKKKPDPKEHKPPRYSFISKKKWTEYRKKQKKKTKANIKETELPKVKDPKKKKRSQNK